METLKIIVVSVWKTISMKIVLTVGTEGNPDKLHLLLFVVLRGLASRDEGRAVGCQGSKGKGKDAKEDEESRNFHGEEEDCFVSELERSCVEN